MAETIEELKAKLIAYEQDGVAKLYYSLNRKANEMAEIMNKNSLANLALDDPKDKTFERLKVIWNDASSIATSVKSLGELAGVTGDENKDIISKNQRTSPESIANVLGNTAGKQD